MRKINKTQRYLLSILSGLLMGVSFPYTGSLFVLVFVAWIPLLLIENQISISNYRSRKVFVHAYIAFFLYNLITTWWIAHASFGGVIMAIFANSFLMAITFQLYHYCKKHLGQKEGYLSLLILWLAFEYFHFHWEVSWPWLHLGNTFSRVPEIVQWYSYSGILGGSLWILIINLLFYRITWNVCLKKESIRIQTPLFFITSLFLLVPIGVSLLQYFSYVEKGAKQTVMVLQPNLDPYTEKFKLGMMEQSAQMLVQAEENGAKFCDLVMAPETALPYEFYEENLKDYKFYPLLQSNVDRWNNHLLIGAATRSFFLEKNSIASRQESGGPGFYESYNSSLLLSNTRKPRFVHKSKLVLGVEKVPFKKFLPFIDQLAIDLDGTSGTLGIEKEPRVYKSPFVFAPVICYESIYGEYIGEQCLKGARLIAIITNDGWWSETPGYRQHFSFARLRAIENRRDVARSANTGTSGFINQRGDVIMKSKYNEKISLKHSVHLNDELTFYSQHGDVLGRTAGFVSFLLILFAWVKRFRARQKLLK
jgi:apolipoprotein N-acyltransferase